MIGLITQRPWPRPTSPGSGRTQQPRASTTAGGAASLSAAAHSRQHTVVAVSLRPPGTLCCGSSSGRLPAGLGESHVARQFEPSQRGHDRLHREAARAGERVGGEASTHGGRCQDRTVVRVLLHGHGIVRVDRGPAADRVGEFRHLVDGGHTGGGVLADEPVAAGRRRGRHRTGDGSERTAELGGVPGGVVYGYPLAMASSAQGACVIYVRMSQDRTGEELGVDRHEKECRDFAKRLNLEVEHVYSDNDKSATSGKARPDFDAMLAARPKAIVAWHQDRLLRLTKDLERVIELGIPVYFVKSAENGLDLSTPAGRAVARTVAAWTQYEGEQKRVRQVSKNQQLAAHGHWQFSLRPFGYERVAGEIVQVPEEADVIREGYERVLRGESYRQLAIDWNRRDIKPLVSDRWTVGRVQQLLENSHYGGVPTYKGEEVDLDDGKTIQWEPILTPRKWKDFRELKLNRKRKRSWAVSPKHLMSGMLSCGVCGGQMFSHSRDVRTRTGMLSATGSPVRVPVYADDGNRMKWIAYVCFEKHCTSIRGEYVDTMVRTMVVNKLADERMVTRMQPTDGAQLILDEIADLQRRRDDVTELVGDGLMDKTKAREKLTDLTARLQRAQSRLDAVRAESPLSDIRLADSIGAHWDQASVLDKRRIIADLGFRLSIMPADIGPRSVDPSTGKKYTESAWALRRVVWNIAET